MAATTLNSFIQKTIQSLQACVQDSNYTAP